MHFNSDFDRDLTYLTSELSGYKFGRYQKIIIFMNKAAITILSTLNIFKAYIHG